LRAVRAFSDWVTTRTEHAYLLIKLAWPRANQEVAAMSDFITELIRSFLGEIIVIQA